MRDETRERDGVKIERTFWKRIKLAGRGNTIYMSFIPMNFEVTYHRNSLSVDRLFGEVA